MIETVLFLFLAGALVVISYREGRRDGEALVRWRERKARLDGEMESRGLMPRPTAEERAYEVEARIAEIERDMPGLTYAERAYARQALARDPHVVLFFRCQFERARQEADAWADRKLAGGW